MEKITILTLVDAPLSKVWEYWTKPEHVTEWNNASADWHTPHAENDLREGGRFRYTMAARDGSTQFDFEGTYTAIDEGACIAYTMDDGRTVRVDFVEKDGKVQIIETFDPEALNPVEIQRSGWQSILNNFKSYVEKSE